MMHHHGTTNNHGLMIHKQLLCLLILSFGIVDGCRIIAFAGNKVVSGKKLLFESENNLPALAFDHPFLPVLDNSKYWDKSQCGLRNSHENRDGWGVGWYPTVEDFSFPLRFRTHESIVGLDNSTAPMFLDLLEGKHEISKINEAQESLGGFTHAQGLLGVTLEVGSCGVETKEIPKAPLESKVVFGHVRKATSNIDERNAHPFVFNHLLWMHNGMLADFDSYKNILLRRLRPVVRGMIQGSVDSEVAGALFCNNLEGFPHRLDYSMAEMRGAMRTMIAELRAFSAEAALSVCHDIAPFDLGRYSNKEEEDGSSSSSDGERQADGINWAPSSMNFAVTDGKGLVVTRFRSKDNEDPPSLYYLLGVEKRYTPSSDSDSDGDGEDDQESQLKFDWSARSWQTDGLVVASEPLEEKGPHLSKWRLLGKDKMISFHPNEGVRIECLSHRCTPDTPVMHVETA